MAKSYGEALKRELEADKQRVWDTINRRDERIAAGETDEDDCFLSIRSNSQHIDEINKKLEVLKGDGFMEIDAYFNTNDAEVFPRWVNTKFGSRFVLDGVFARSEQQLFKKVAGLYKRKVRVPVWVKIEAGVGGGMCAVYTARNVFCRSRFNYVNGKDYCVHTNGQEISYIELANGVYISLKKTIDKDAAGLYHNGKNTKGDSMIFENKAAAIIFLKVKGLTAEGYFFFVCKNGILTDKEAI